MTPGFTTHESSCRKKQKRTLNTPVSPWEISDTYSKLQMSAILMNTPKIEFLGIRFVRIALKSQHSLAETTQNRQEIDFLIPKQGGTWAILNKKYCFWENTSSQVKKKVSQSSIKTFRSYRISKNELESSQVAIISFGGILLLAREIWSWLMPLLIPVITILMLLMIAPCIINCLARFVSAQVNKLQHAVPVQQGYIKLHPTTEI